MRRIPLPHKVYARFSAIRRTLPYVALLLAITALGSGPSSHAQSLCPELAEKLIQLSGREIIATQVSEATPELPKLIELLRGPEDVTIGVSEEPVHFFFVTGDQRYNATPLQRGSFSVIAPGTEPTRGLYFILKDVPANVRAKLIDGLQDKTPALSCVHGSCRRLQDAGLLPNETIPLRIEPALERFLFNAVITSDGKELDKKIVLYSSKSFEEFLALAHARDQGIVQNVFKKYTERDSGVYLLSRMLRDVPKDVQLAAIAEIEKIDDTAAGLILLALEKKK